MRTFLILKNFTICFIRHVIEDAENLENFSAHILAMVVVFLVCSHFMELFFPLKKLVDWCFFSELVDEVLIDPPDILFFLLLRSGNVIKLLRFMVVLFIWVIKNVSWKEGDLLWNVCLHWIFYFVKIISYILLNP